MNKRARWVLTVCGAAVAVAAIGATAFERPAGAQSTTKLLLMGPSYPYANVPISLVTAQHGSAGYGVRVDANGAVNYTCTIKVATLDQALALRAQIIEAKTTTVDCRGAYASQSATSKTTLVDETTTPPHDFEINGNP